VLADPSDRQLGHLIVLQIWQDMFLGCITILRWRPRRGGFSRARMLVRRWWICRSSPTSSMGGGRPWPKTTWVRPSVNMHNDMRLVACSMHVHRLTKPHCQWCSLGSFNGGGSIFLLACVSTTLDLGDGRWLRWLQETLRINLYFLISYI
jgi:hypothetical protein